MCQARLLDRAREDHAEAAARVAGLEGGAAAAARDGAALPDRRAAARRREEAAHRAAEELAAAEEELAVLDARLAAHTEAAALDAQHAEARAAWLDVRQRCLAAREEVLSIRAARLEGMAAEIAGDLAVGACCPVCGSDDHPAKAVAAPGAPDAEREREAERRVVDLAAHELACDDRVRSVATRLAVARSHAGDESAETLGARRAPLVARADELRSPAADAPAASQAATALAAEAERATETAHRIDVELAQARTRLTHVALQEQALSAELAALLDGTDAEDLDDLLARHRGRHQACDAAVQAREAATAALEATEQAEADLASLLAEHGVPDAAAARRAYLSPAEVDALAGRVAEHERRAAAARAVLDDPVLAGAAEEPAPDVPAGEAALAAAVDRLARARHESTVWTGRRDRLVGLRDDLAERLAAWAPVRAEHRAVADLAAFVEGKAGDNRLQMRLAAYVLAYRLTQVVAAANERLARMSDRRYSLEHSGRAGAGERRGGLGLVVRDDWSGEDRDPVTLSGGETFVVSLALALGLADVITREAGGAELDTLFVDEGFGSLDADTLDDVLDTLDELRDGGRVVGVVSHVTEMRERIPARLEVRKGRTGSTVAVRRS